MVWWEGMGFGVTQMKFGILNKSSLWASASSFQLFFFFFQQVFLYFCVPSL